MNKHPELERIEGAAAAFAFVPSVPPSPPPGRSLGIKALVLLLFLGGAGALAAAFIATRPYQLEAQIAKEQAAVARQEAETARGELARIRQCVVGGQ